MADTLLIQQIALTLIPGLGPKRTRDILQTFEHPMEVFRAPLRDFQHLGFFSSEIYKALHSKELMVKAERIAEKCHKNHVDITFYTDTQFPHRLAQCDDAPVVLYTKGNALKSFPYMIGIVGSRSTTPYGIQFVKDFITAIQSFPVCVVSGLAYGIDHAAHTHCLQLSVPTVACVAHGLHTVYPASHRDIAERMELNGGLVSEYAPGVFADRERFPMRNRIIAGLTDAVIIVESAESGGSLITAQFAQQYNRDIYALPGKITDEKSAGCNGLIKKSIAAIIQDIPSLLQDLGMKGQLTLDLFEPIASPNAQRLLDVLKEHRSLHVDELLVKSGLSSSLFSSELFELEINGRIHKLPGCRVAFAR
jgi:DNA processing protein